MTSRTRSRPLHIALEIDGASTANPGADPLSPRHLAEVVAGAERAGLTLATFDDSPLPPDGGLRLDATTRAAYVATLTDRIALAPASHVTTAEPFHLAAQLASLDHATHGRAAWLVGATARPEALATVGRPPIESGALRQEVADVVEVVRRLWDSWEDDAVIKDVATGRYLDPGKVHHVDFHGETFSVKGPLITPRPPQGSLVVLAPDTLAAAARPDVALVADPDPDEVRRRAHHARDHGTPLVFAEADIAFGATGPIGRTGRLRHHGSPADLVSLLRTLAGSVDGVRLHPAALATDLPVLAGQVLPALREAGLHAPPETGATLRESLGLARPANRFAALPKG